MTIKVTYQGNTYRFIGYSNLSGSQITAEKGGKFYRFPVEDCEIIRNTPQLDFD